MNSRANGDIFEYYFAHVLQLSGAKPLDIYTKGKILRLAGKIDTCDITMRSRIILFRKISKFIQPIGAKSFTMQTDNNGIVGDVTDIKLFTNDGVVNISLKRNNSSVKHQRPSNLCTQLGMNSVDYKKSYETLNTKWYTILRNYVVFSNIPKGRKDEMYSEFNELYANTINNNQQCRNAFLDFIVSNSVNNKFIVEWVPSGSKLNVYNCKKLIYPTTMNATYDNNYVNLEFFDANDDPYIELQLRLHNASKNITKTLSVKYDTKILGMKNIYENYVI